MIKLSELKPAAGAHRKNKRVGRGPGSGWGKTAGVGSKGQKSRSGGKVRPDFEGGQMPLARRLPKGGFKNYLFKEHFNILNVRDLERFEANSVVDFETLKAEGLISKNSWKLKLLGQGELKKPVTIKVNKASRSAVAKVEAAGGKVEVI
jgi:large subunit ribosomal protein L15